jgi:hypothetical protein
MAERLHATRLGGIGNGPRTPCGQLLVLQGTSHGCARRAPT